MVFDFDGVLADTLDEMLHIAGHGLREMGYPCQPSPNDLNALNKMEFVELGSNWAFPSRCRMNL